MSSKVYKIKVKDWEKYDAWVNSGGRNMLPNRTNIESLSVNRNWIENTSKVTINYIE